jgi:Cys-rich repeat protein
VRVAILDATALASGVLSFQSAATGSAIYNTSICGVGDIPTAQVAFGSVTVTLVECISDGDCGDGQFCNGTEICNLTTHTCEPGISPSCDDQWIARMILVIRRPTPERAA